MLFPTAGSDGYKGVLDALRPIEEQPRLQLQPNDGAHSLKARLLEGMQTEQDAVRKLDASLGQKLMRLADLYRCLKSVAEEEYTTGYGQVLMEDQIGHAPRRVSRLAVENDPTDPQMSPFFLVLRTENGGYAGFEIDAEDYASMKAEVAFKTGAGTAASSAEDAPKAAKDSSKVAAPPKAAKEDEQPKKKKGALTKNTPRRSNIDGELNPKVRAWLGSRQLPDPSRETVLIEDDEDDDSESGESAHSDESHGRNNEEGCGDEEGSNESSDESTDESSDDVDGGTSEKTKPRADPRKDGPQTVRFHVNKPTDRAEILVHDSPGKRVSESPRTAAKPKTSVLPLVNAQPSANALLAHIEELLTALDETPGHPYGMFNKDLNRTIDLYLVRGPARSRSRARSYSPCDRQLWCRLL
jgi:hypothetical protein